MPPDDPNDSSASERALEGVTAGYIAEMQERWQSDPASVDPEWRALFEPAIPATDGHSAAPPSPDATPPAAEAPPPALPAPAPPPGPPRAGARPAPSE